MTSTLTVFGRWLGWRRVIIIGDRHGSRRRRDRAGADAAQGDGKLLTSFIIIIVADGDLQRVGVLGGRDGDGGR